MREDEPSDRREDVKDELFARERTWGEYEGLPVEIVPAELRHDFALKVFAVLGLQLLGVVAVAGPIVCLDELHVLASPGALAVAGVATVTACVVGRRPEGRRYPANYGVLALLMVGEGLGLAAAPPSALVAVLLAAGVLLVGTAGAATARLDFASRRARCAGALLFAVLSGFVAVLFPIPSRDKLVAVGAALAFLAFLVRSVTRIVGGQRPYSLALEDHAFAALTVYLDLGCR